MNLSSSELYFKEPIIQFNWLTFNILFVRNHNVVWHVMWNITDHDVVIYEIWRSWSISPSMKILLKRDASYIKPHWKPHQIHVSTSALGVGIRHISCKIFNYKVLAHLGLKLNVSQWPFTHLGAWWVSAPQTHNRVSNVNFDRGGRLHKYLL